MTYKRLIRSLCLLLGLGLAVPTSAGDLKDSADEATHDTRKAVRQHKPGGEDLGDKADDAKDTAASKKDQAKKKGRKAKSKLRKDINDEPR